MQRPNCEIRQRKRARQVKATVMSSSRSSRLLGFGGFGCFGGVRALAFSIASRASRSGEFLSSENVQIVDVQEVAKLLNKVLTRNMKCSQTQSGEPRRWTCRYLLTYGIGRFIRVPALTLFRWLQHMQRKDMTIVWTACGSSTQWWSRDLLGTLYILGDGRSPLALRLRFPRSSASRDKERYLGRRMRTTDVNCSSLKKYPRPSRLEAPPKSHSSRLQFWTK